MEYPVNHIVNELKIINLVLELVPIDSEFKKNLNLHAIALALKPRLNKIAHDMVAGELKENELVTPEWQPKFKVGDWVSSTASKWHDIMQVSEIVYKNKSYKAKYPNGQISCFAYDDYTLKIFQPMQELKDELSQWRNKYYNDELVERNIANNSVNSDAKVIRYSDFKKILDDGKS